MKKYIFVIFFIFIGIIYGQELPAFMLEIQKEKPNFFTVEKLYKEYAEEYKEKNPKSIYLENQEREEFKNPYEKQYIEWIRLNRAYINEEGFIVKPSLQELQKDFNISARQARSVNATTQASYNSDIPYHTTFDGWSYDGPTQVTDINTGKDITRVANVRAFAQSKSNPNFLYSAVEASSLFVSRNKGNTWHYATKGYTGMNEIGAIGISPINEYYAYAGNVNGIFATKDGGVTWQLINDNTYNSSISLPTGHIEGSNVVTKIVVQNTNSNSEQDFVLIATQKGLFKITNNGTSYSFRKVVNFFTTDIIKKPGSSTIFYSLAYEESTNHLYFYESTDSGDTWHKKGNKNGWYDPTTSIPIEKFQGGRLAVTDINPEVVYAYVIEGRQGKNDNSFLGIYKSSDSGSSWTLPNTNGPGEGANGYNENNINLATFPSDYYGYNQGFYNCAIMVNPNNENEIILGGLNVYKSTDGAKTWRYLGGYQGLFNLHPDSQTFYTQKNNDGTVDYWITTDGGINYSNDFFNKTQNHQVKTKGLTVSYWGFDVGEKTGNYIGGGYHNGDKLYVDTYPRGANKFIGGAEEATGYVLSDYNERYMNTYYNNVVAPTDYNSNSDYLAFSGVLSPFPYESLDPSTYNNKDYNGNLYYFTYNEGSNTSSLYKNSGKLYESNSSFLSTIPGKIYSHVVDFNNPSIQYLYVENSKMYVSNDEGKTWELKTSPFGPWVEKVYIAIDGADSNKIYALRRYSYSNSLKVSTDQGRTWSNLSTPPIYANYKYIQTVRGISNVYFLLSESNSNRDYTKVYYFYNNQWIDHSENLPSDMGTLKLKVHINKGKLYLPTHGYGVWTSDLPKPILEILSKVELNINVDIDKTYKVNYQFNFSDKSTVIGKDIIEYKWRFPGSSSVTNANTKNPLVQYNKVGKFSVELELIDNQGQSYKKIFPNYITILPSCNCSLPIAISNNMSNVKVWFDANDFENDKIKDKISKELYSLSNKNITIETESEFNNQKVFNIKAGVTNANILLNKTVEGKTLFIVNSLYSNSTSDFPFLFGHSTVEDFHSEKNTLFSNNWITDRTRFDSTNGGLTQINGIQTNYFVTAQKTIPTLYSIRTANGKIGGKVSSISKDRSYDNRNWQGKIAEVLIFDKQLTDAEVQDINKYLMDKYNIK